MLSQIQLLGEQWLRGSALSSSSFSWLKDFFLMSVSLCNVKYNFQLQLLVQSSNCDPDTYMHVHVLPQKEGGILFNSSAFHIVSSSFFFKSVHLQSFLPLRSSSWCCYWCFRESTPNGKRNRLWKWRRWWNWSNKATKKYKSLSWKLRKSRSRKWANSASKNNWSLTSGRAPGWAFRFFSFSFSLSSPHTHIII